MHLTGLSQLYYSIIAADKRKYQVNCFLFLYENISIVELFSIFARKHVVGTH